MRKHERETPEGWSVEEGDLVLRLTPPGGQARAGVAAGGDAREPSVFIVTRDSPEGAAPPLAQERLRALPGYRPVSAERSPFRGGRLFTYAFGGGGNETVVRAHLFAAGGRSFTVVAQAAREGWEDGALLALARRLEANIARESGEELEKADLNPCDGAPLGTEP